MSRLKQCLEPRVMWLAFRVALFIGTVLNVIHHFDLLFGTPLTATVAAQLTLSYLVPYCVSTHGQVFGRR